MFNPPMVEAMETLLDSLGFGPVAQVTSLVWKKSKQLRIPLFLL